MKNTKRKTRTMSLLKAIRRKFRRRNYSYGYNTKYFYPRHLARSIAKANMKKEGMRHINSIFHYTWRSYVRAR